MKSDEGVQSVRRKRGRKQAGRASPSARTVDYHNLRSPFPPMDVFSADQVHAIHETSLKTLEELGMKVLLPARGDGLYRPRNGGSGVSVSPQIHHRKGRCA